MFWLFKKKKDNDASLKKLSEGEIQSQLYGHLKGLSPKGTVPEEETEQGLSPKGTVPEPKGAVPEEPREEKPVPLQDLKTRIKEISSIINHEKSKQILIGIGFGIAGILVIAIMFSIMIKFAPRPKPVKKGITESQRLKTQLLKPYTIQAATFSRKSDADNAIEKLSSKGYSARFIRSDSKKGRTLYRIYVDNFAKKADAKGTLDRLKSEGFRDSFIRLER